jgi:hypothetical protein
MPDPQIPEGIRGQLVSAARFLVPLLDPAVLTEDGHLLLRVLSSFTCRAEPDLVRRQIRCASAVYAAWDSRRGCRYVGSVCRRGQAAVGDRLAEHYQLTDIGPARRAAWALLTVLPIRTDAPPGIVRAAEGWTARNLSPLEGSAHPQVELGQPPAALAQTLSIHELSSSCRRVRSRADPPTMCSTDS